MKEQEKAVAVQVQESIPDENIIKTTRQISFPYLSRLTNRNSTNFMEYRVISNHIKDFDRTLNLKNKNYLLKNHVNLN